MTIQNPALFISGESHPAEDVRRWVSASAQDRPGVLAGAEFMVTEKSTASMGLDVAAGRAYVAGTESAFQGLYFAESRSTETVTIGTADGTNGRVDLVVLRVQDAAYSGGTAAVSLAVVAGAAAASPLEPVVPANCLVLAAVAVGAGVSVITDANITDRRLSQGLYPGNVGGYAAAMSSNRVVTGATRPAAPKTGEQVFETDSGKTRIYNGTAWSELAYTDVLESTVPAGLVAMSVFPTVPVGWLELNGQAIAGADGLYPDLWAAAPAAWKSGTTLTLPNMKGRLPVHLDTGQTEFNALELTGGSKTRTLSKANLPTHVHTNNHTHSDATTDQDDHNHDTTGVVSGLKGGQYGFVEGGTGRLTIDTRATSVSSNKNLINGYAHDHNVPIPSHSGNTGNGSGDGLAATAVQILAPYFVLRFIIKA